MSVGFGIAAFAALASANGLLGAGLRGIFEREGGGFAGVLYWLWCASSGYMLGLLLSGAAS